jgi:hypothetical protein
VSVNMKKVVVGVGTDVTACRTDRRKTVNGQR